MRPGALRAAFGVGATFHWGDLAVEIASKKPLAMLCYLCLHPRPATREALAELLWGPGRLLNVRQALYQLRQLPGAEEWLHDGDEVEVRSDCNVLRFQEAVEEGRYRDALEAWRPPLLASLKVSGAPHFSEWLELQRAQLEGYYLRALENRAAELEREGDFGAALRLTVDFLELDPLRETGYRSAMRLSYLLGDTAAALDYYRTCQQVMREELGSEPLPATRELAVAISSGEELPVVSSPGHLPPELLRLLQALVVGENRVSALILAQVLEMDEFEVAEGLAELERRRLVAAGGFLSAAVIAEAQSGIAAPMRRLLHGRLARALEEKGGEGREEEIGNHWLRAGSPEKGVPFLLDALRKATEASDDAPARLLAYRVLWAGDTEGRFEAALHLEGLAARKADGELQDAAIELADDLAWQLQDDLALIKIDLRKGRRSLQLRDPAAAQAVGEEALEAAERLGDPHFVAQAVNLLGVVNFHKGQLDEARSWFGRNAESPISEERFRAYNNLGAVAGLAGDLKASYAHLDKALTLARQERRVDEISACLNNLAATAERLARYDKAIEQFREGRDLAKRTGVARNAVQALLNIAQVHSRKGALGPAWNTAQEALTEAEELNEGRLVGQAFEQLGQLSRHIGDPGAAEDFLTRSLAQFAELEDERKQAEVRCNLNFLRLPFGSAQEWAQATQTVGGLEELGLREIARWFWAELALATGDPEDCERWVAKATEGGANVHLELMTDFARLRMTLLQGEAVAKATVDQLQERLGGMPIAESPWFHRLLARAVSGCEQEQKLQRRARELLDEQGQGLPRKLKEVLHAQSERW